MSWVGVLYKCVRACVCVAPKVWLRRWTGRGQWFLIWLIPAAHTIMPNTWLAAFHHVTCLLVESVRYNDFMMCFMIHPMSMHYLYQLLLVYIFTYVSQSGAGAPIFFFFVKDEVHSSGQTTSRSGLADPIISQPVSTLCALTPVFTCVFFTQKWYPGTSR